MLLRIFEILVFIICNGFVKNDRNLWLTWENAFLKFFKINADL